MNQYSTSIVLEVIMVTVVDHRDIMSRAQHPSDSKRGIGGEDTYLHVDGFWSNESATSPARMNE